MVKAFGLFFEDKRIWLILGGSVYFLSFSDWCYLARHQNDKCGGLFPNCFSNERQSGQINLEPASGFPFSGKNAHISGRSYRSFRSIHLISVPDC